MRNRIIAAVRDSKLLLQVCRSPVDLVFLLSGGLCDLEEHCRLLHQAGKKVFLHIDLLDGLKGDSSGIRFLAKYCQPEGIISTKVQCLKIAREAGMQTILRCFVIDTLALKTGTQHVHLAKPDFVEVLPGLSTKIIRLAAVHFGIPVIAGGLLNDPEDIAAAFEAGAAAVSTSVPKLWTSDILHDSSANKKRETRCASKRSTKTL
ncbi:MAG: glycerol-3-phosphate responsive antiterminator [Lentisphaeria bacterium]|nr:glycerol-3-phosphate responsive antiterminator [Lentisphaeria bacterium]